jgi:RNA polymerase-binding transcription factor DksA
MTTALSAEELSRIREQLSGRERQLLDELRSGRERAESESFERVASEVPDAGDASVADVAADGLSAERQRDFEELGDVQDALARIENGSYGTCLTCGEPIEPQRLRALPTAKYDLRHQEGIERQDGGSATPTL